MRVREMSYNDHGINSREEVQYIKDFCKNANEEQRKMIKLFLSELNPYMADCAYRSLVNGFSYEDICCKNYLYIGKGDFYGYRRKGMGAIKRWMILYGIWEL